MEISRQEIKALASDTRVAILKSLGGRRKMPSELSREFSMAPSTVVEHLHILKSAGLIKGVETGHKWKYYELTEKGRGLVIPRFPMQFVVMLSVGVLAVFGSLAGLLSEGTASLGGKELSAPVYSAGAQIADRCVTAINQIEAPMPPIPLTYYIPHALLVIGILLIMFAAVKLWSKWK